MINYELNVFKKIIFLGKISRNWPNDLLGTNVYKTFNLVDNRCWQYCNGVILLQWFLNEERVQHFHFYLFWF